MDLRIEAVAKEARQAQGRNYYGVKVGQVWYNLMVDHKPEVGQTYAVTVNTSEYKGKTYRWADLLPSPPTAQESKPAANGNTNGAAHAQEQAKEPAPEQPKDGRIPLLEWCAAMKAFHRVALELEPDGETMGEVDSDQGTHTVRAVVVDRSHTRAAILNTCLIAYSNNKIAFEIPEGGGVPF